MTPTHLLNGVLACRVIAEREVIREGRAYREAWVDFGHGGHGYINADYLTEIIA